jgi:hypothetical protein
MNSGSKIVGLWGNQDAPHDEVIELRDALPDEVFADAPVEEPVEPPPSPLIPALCAIAALLWVVFVCWTAWTGFAGQAPTLPQIGALIATASAPLALIGVVYLLLMRTSRSEARRFGATAAAMHNESIALEQRLAAMIARLEENRAALAAQADQLLALGDGAVSRIAGIGGALKDEGEEIDRRAEALRASAADARADLDAVLASLPKAQVQTRQMAASLQEAGAGAQENAAALETQLSALSGLAREADEVAAASAQRLAAQGAAIAASVQQSRDAIAGSGIDSAETLGQRIAEINAQVDWLGSRLAAHDESGRGLVDRLTAALADVEARLAALDVEGGARTERLTTAVIGLTDHADRLAAALRAGGDAADGLVSRSETLLTALDASAREIDETLPAAFARLDRTATASRDGIAALKPDMGALENSANTALDRLAQTEKLLTQQRETMDLLAAAAEQGLVASKRHADDLSTAVGIADEQTRALAEGAGPQLIDVMLRVRDTAAQAADRARETLGRIIPDTASALGAASDEALQKAVSDRVEAQMTAIAEAADRAAEAAARASQRLTEQLASIGETAGEIEARFEASRAEIEEANREGFARRVSALIEGMNSATIDVTRILSSEVADSAWEAYLKGDRGVFTRRAVRLLDNGDARAIVSHYETDALFRENVNRYVHDFESMLKTVLANRDGSALGVTILSSDMGKLYVALAQAIEKLRQ